MQVEISIGELFDKLTILEIKIDKINDPTKLENVTKEWNALNEKSMDILSIFADSVLFKKIDQLKNVNEELWWVEDSIRENEKKQIFDKEFVELARAVYKLNEAAINEIEYEDKYTALHLAIYASQTREVVKFILEKCPQNIKVEDKYGEYPIHLTHNDETLFTLVDYFVQKHNFISSLEKKTIVQQTFQSRTESTHLNKKVIFR